MRILIRIENGQVGDGMADHSISCKNAGLNDVNLLASMNKSMILDEGHRNRMGISELTSRMRAWLQADYQACIFECTGRSVGYALYRPESEWFYLRQFFIEREWRRQGLGRQAIDLLAVQWAGTHSRIRLDVLSGNRVGLAFWRSVGFEEYCITLERHLP